MLHNKHIGAATNIIMSPDARLWHIAMLHNAIRLCRRGDITENIIMSLKFAVQQLLVHCDAFLLQSSTLS
jgi:hypothetical protein